MYMYRVYIPSQNFGIFYSLKNKKATNILFYLIEEFLAFSENEKFNKNIQFKQ